MLEILSSYLFLRSFSLQLQLSPFEPEAFDSCISCTEHNPLLDEIHCVLLKACIHNIKDENPRSNDRVDWSMLDRFTWTEYILPLITEYGQYYLKYQEKGCCRDEFSSELNDIVDATKLISDSALNRISYISIPAQGKLLIIRCLITLLLSNENFRRLIDYRIDVEQELGHIDSDKDKGNTLPLFPKGEDGSPEECILCGHGGDLLCCDVCPAVYHQSCLRTAPSEFEDTWACYECSTLDPMNSRLRLPVIELDKMSISFVGRFILQDLGLEDENGNSYRLLNFSDIKELLDALTITQISSYPWKNYRTALGRTESYYTYKKILNSPWTDADSAILSEISLLICSYDYRAALHNPSDQNNSEEKSCVADSCRSSARLSELESTKAEEDAKIKVAARFSTDGRRLAGVFDHFSYVNRYGSALSNLYLGMRSEIPGFPVIVADSDLGVIVTKSIIYKESKFQSLCDTLKIVNDTYFYREKEAGVDGSLVVPPATSPRIISCWPLYGQIPVRSLCRFLEALYNTLGSIRLNDLVLDINTSTTRNIKNSTLWLDRLSFAVTVGAVRNLTQELVAAIHPCAFLPTWFLSPPEILTDIDNSIENQKKRETHAGLKQHADLGSAPLKGQYWIGQHPRTGAIRVPIFLKLCDVFQYDKKKNGNGDGEGDGDGDGDDEMDDGEKKERKKNVNISKRNNDDDDEEEENDNDNDNDNDNNERNEINDDNNDDNDDDNDDDDDDDSSEGNKISFINQSPRLSSFTAGRNLLPQSQRARVPPKLLKKLARLGGRALLPFVVYPKCPTTYPFPPTAWLWSYRLQRSVSAEGVGLQLRFLEGYLRIGEMPLGMLGSKTQVS
jgi:DDT domain